MPRRGVPFAGQSPASAPSLFFTKRRRNRELRAEFRVMGAAVASFGLLADAVTTAQRFVSDFIYVYILLIFVYVLLSFVRLPYSIWGNRIQRFLYDVTEPYLRLFRRFLPPLGPLDLSPLIGTIVLIALQQIIVRLLDHAH
jgi:YggT family protein